MFFGHSLSARSRAVAGNVHPRIVSSTFVRSLPLVRRVVVATAKHRHKKVAEKDAKDTPAFKNTGSDTRKLMYFPAVYRTL